MKEIKIVQVKEITTKDNRKFNAYKTVDKRGKLMDVKFVQGCRNVPVKPCTILVDPDQCNVDTTRQYPCLWVKNVEEIKETVHKTNFDEYFADEIGDESEYEDLA